MGLHPELSKPTLTTVQTHQTGFFYYPKKVNNGWKTIKSIVHPKWFEQKEFTKQYTISLDSRVVAALDQEHGKRWTSKEPKWVMKKNDPNGVGFWLYHVRTGMKGKERWVRSEDLHRFRDKQSNVGRPASGRAYKVRRAIWRTLVSSNLSSALKHYGHRAPGRKEVVSLRLPDLSLAVFELLKAHFPFTEEHLHVLTAWSKLKNVNWFESHDVRPLLYAERRDQLAFLKHVSETSWKAVLAGLLEGRYADQTVVSNDVGQMEENENNSLLLNGQLGSNVIIPKHAFEWADTCTHCKAKAWTYCKPHEYGFAKCGVCGLVIDI
jgi:hypothetical protein